MTRERSLDSILDTLAAVRALADKEERVAIVQEFLMVFPTHLTDSDQILVLKELFDVIGDGQSFIDCVATVLPKVNDATAISWPNGASPPFIKSPIQ